MLYTGKGDNGTTKLFDCQSGQRVGKDAPIVDALGCVDELTSFTGLCKVHADKEGLALGDELVAKILGDVQHGLFSVQAELGGADVHISKEMTEKLEQWIATVESEIPPITSFSLPGGTELSALLDVARTLARKAERKVVSVSSDMPERIQADTLAYVNRLSSLFFALARLSNHKSGIKEESPDYR